MTIKKSFEEWGRSPGDGGLFGERETERKMNIILNNSILSVDMKRVRRNVATVLEELQGAQLIPVLKDNAYGLGLEAMGHVMEEFPQITTLAVAQVGEGAALRQAGITREILIWAVCPPICCAQRWSWTSRCRWDGWSFSRCWHCWDSRQAGG